ncbi:MAG TPA: glycosyltransferase [Syntrophales bacterium]|nr:glycosyltransferase [Syntrophales bacterium]
MKRAKGAKRRDKDGPEISLCMIVRDEEACLGRCLESVRPWVDEIVVVDTGSTDRTVEIAQGFGARVYHHPWENDFSKHRNQSLSYARGRWIFQLDADEELFPEDGPLLRRIVAGAEADYYHCRFFDLRKDGTIHGTFYLVRLFRGDLGMTYERKVHNQLRTVGRGAYCNLRVRHYGYDLSKERMEAKHLRTTRLLEEMLAEDPDDPYCLFQLSSSYSMHRDFAKAVAYGERALAVMREKNLRNGYFLTCFYTVAQGYLALDRPAEAERVCREALALFPYHLDMYHVLAAAAFRRGDRQGCREASEGFLALFDRIERDPSLTGSFYCHSIAKRHEIYVGLGCVCLQEGDHERAEEFFRKALGETPQPLALAESVCRHYLAAGRSEAVLPWLARVYEGGRAAGRTAPLLEERPALFLPLGKFFLLQGSFEAARDCLDRARRLPLSPEERMGALAALIRATWSLGDTDGLAAALEETHARLGLDAGGTIDSLNDLGAVLYDLAAALGERRLWQAAAALLGLAVEIAPGGLDRERFANILKS